MIEVSDSDMDTIRLALYQVQDYLETRDRATALLYMREAQRCPLTHTIGRVVGIVESYMAAEGELPEPDDE